MSPADYERQRLERIAKMAETVQRRIARTDMRTAARIRAEKKGAPAPVQVVWAGVTYPSIKAAAQATGIPFSTIRDWKLGRLRSARRQQFMFDVNTATSG